MTTRASVISPYQKFYALDGITVLAGGSIAVYENGTIDLLAIYADADLTIPQDNPYTLDAGGAINGDVHFEGFATLTTFDSEGGEVNSFDDVSCFDQSTIFGLWDPGFNYSNDGSASTIVQSPVNDLFYISIQNNNLDHEPSVSPLWWSPWPFPSLAKGSIFAGTGTAIAALPVGTNGRALVANSAQATGLEWVDAVFTPATQTQMEAATSNLVNVTPLNTNWHPGVSKCWLKAAGAGTSILASHNITSITDSGTGILDVTIATDFSSANYEISMSVGDLFLGVVGSTLAAGSFRLQSYDTLFAAADPAFYMASCFGDQA